MQRLARVFQSSNIPHFSEKVNFVFLCFCKVMQKNYFSEVGKFNELLIAQSFSNVYVKKYQTWITFESFFGTI